jgi:hypothetical protein
VDPDGDVILKLESPTDPFAPECESATPDGSQSAGPTSTALNKIVSPDAAAELGEDRASIPVTFRVSSRHLALASPVFKSALTGGWKESTKTEGGLRTINTQGWDATALGIFLNAIHGQCKKVPRTLTLEMLAKIAVIVDYYAAHETMEILSAVWIDKLRGTVTNLSDRRTTALWICISWIFGDSLLFQQATIVAVLYYRSNMTDFGLPMPGQIIGKDRMQTVARLTAMKRLADDIWLPE